MRDLRAELRVWNEGVPVEWKPVEGDILVGFVRDHPPIDPTSAGGSTVVVEEERTGVPVLVSLDSPQLAVLFEIHNPRSNDRVGIKCTGCDSDGNGRFIMVIDRESRPTDQINESLDDDCCATTPEERDFIEQMLSDETSMEIPEDCPAAEGPKIIGVIRREEENLARQTVALQRLEAVISQSPLHVEDSADSTTANAVDQPLSASMPVVDMEIKPARKKRWLRFLLFVFVLLVSGAAGVAISILYPTFHWWIR